MASWEVGAIASAVIALAYLAIGLTILRGLRHGRQLRTNRLGLATAAIFISCSIGHAAHLYHIAEVMAQGRLSAERLGLVYDWHLVGIDVATGAVAVWYLTLRSQYRRLLLRPTLFPDLDAARARAVELNDAVVQELVTARYAFQLGESAVGEAAVDRALERATALVHDALGEGGQAPHEPDAPDVARGPARA